MLKKLQIGDYSDSYQNPILIFLFLIYLFDTMKIRAHHLLCMQGFQGYGYSEDFTKNMAEIIEILQNFPKRKIEIIAGSDVICACCPYDINGTCQESQGSNEKIMSMDVKVLKKLEIPPGSVFEAEEIFNIINKKLKTHLDVKEICGDCRWSEKCLWFISKSKIN